MEKLPDLQIGRYIVTTLVTGGHWKENCYIVQDAAGEQCLIDPGDDGEEIIAFLEKSNMKPCKLLLTHAHHDHVGAAAAISRRFAIPCELHHADLRLLHHAPMYGLRFANRKIELPNDIRTFKDHTHVLFSDTLVQIVPTPGHTQGSVCYVFCDFVCTGDTLLNHHIGRVDLPGADGKLLQGSIDKLLAGLDDSVWLLPGHGAAWGAGAAKEWWQNARHLPPEYKHPV